MEKGVFCLSLDTEFLWGRDNPQAFIEDAKKARAIIKKLLLLFQKYKIPATWALVGELFNPGDSLRHAPDIIEVIKENKNQEIACHSFSHLDFSQISASQAEKEIEKCLAVARKNKINFRSFIFPFNKINHLEILKRHGFTHYRGQEKSWSSQLSKFFQILDFLLLFTPPVSLVAKDKLGLINAPASMYFVSARGLRKFIPAGWRLRKAKKGLKAAVAKKMIFHLWLHEIDLGRNTEKMFWELEAIIKYAAQLRDAGKLEIKSMSQVMI